MGNDELKEKIEKAMKTGWDHACDEGVHEAQRALFGVFKSLYSQGFLDGVEFLKHCLGQQTSYKQKPQCKDGWGQE